MVSELFSALVCNHSLILQVAFIANKYNLCIVPAVSFYLSYPYIYRNHIESIISHVIATTTKNKNCETILMFIN